MNYLTLDYIKQHSRIDYDCEDGLLEMYGDSAEDTVLNVCNRTYDDLVEVYGHILADGSIQGDVVCHQSIECASINGDIRVQGDVKVGTINSIGSSVTYRNGMVRPALVLTGRP